MDFNLENKIAVFGDVTKRLGSIFFYSLSEQLVSVADLQNKFSQSGLDERFFPASIKVVDAYRKATTACETYRIPFGNCYINYLIREVSCDSDQVQRQVVEEIVDAKNKQLSFTPDVVKLILHRKTGELEIQHGQLYQPVPENSEAVYKLITNVENLYEEYRTHYTSRTIREVVGNILNSMRPTAVRPSGGVYFVHENYTDELEKLVGFIRTFSGRSEAWTIPLVDSEDMRAMISLKFRDQVREVMHRLAAVLRKENASPWEMRQCLSQAKDTMESIREYEEALNEGMGDLRAECELIEKQVLTLLEKVA